MVCHDAAIAANEGPVSKKTQRKVSTTGGGRKLFGTDGVRGLANEPPMTNATGALRCRGVTKIWGEGTTACASDAKHFGAWDQNLLSEWHRRYGGRGVAVYWHVEKHATCIYSQLKTVASSEVAAMLSLFTVIISGIEGGDTFADAASHGSIAR